MRNQEHLALMVLAYALFLYGSHNIALIEQQQLSINAYSVNFLICTLGLCLFTNSILTVYLRAMKVLGCEQELINSHTKQDMANKKGGHKKKMRFLKNIKGSVGVKTVIIMSIAFFVFAIIGSQALNYLAVAVNASVDSTVTIVAVTITSILFAIGVALRFLPGK